MKLTWRMSGSTCSTSPARSAPRPSAPSAQCSTVPPAAGPPRGPTAPPRAAGEERPPPPGAVRPVQPRAAGEVPAEADERHARADLARVAVPEDDGRIGAHHPLAVGGVQVDGGVEGAAPLHHRRIVVR